MKKTGGWWGDNKPFHLGASKLQLDSSTNQHHLIWIPPISHEPALGWIESSSRAPEDWLQIQNPTTKYQETYTDPPANTCPAKKTPASTPVVWCSDKCWAMAARVQRQTPGESSVNCDAAEHVHEVALQLEETLQRWQEPTHSRRRHHTAVRILECQSLRPCLAPQTPYAPQKRNKIYENAIRRQLCGHLGNPELPKRRWAATMVEWAQIYQHKLEEDYSYSDIQTHESDVDVTPAGVRA